MKYFIPIIILTLAFAGCGSNKPDYSKWTVNDGWSDSFGKLDKFSTISFEYPDCFQKLTQVEYENSPITIDIVGDMNDQIYHWVEFGRSINEEVELKESIHNGSLSKISFTLHTSDSLTKLAADWNDHPLSNETFPEFFLKDFISTSQGVLYNKQITVSGFQANSAKMYYQNTIYEEPYQNRVIIFTCFLYNDKFIEINMDSWAEEAEEVEVYYNHLLQTFLIEN